MASTSDELEKWGADVISGKEKGVLPFLLRRVLSLFSLLFRAIAVFRVNSYLGGRFEQAEFATTVVSVGNLTVGGTGKTPVVEKLSTDLCARNRKVGILSRGYKSKALQKPQTWQGVDKDDADEVMPKVVSAHGELFLKPPYSGDEPYMLAKNLREVAVLVGKDRIRSARFGVEHLGLDTLILDDGMQYLPLKHKYDLVLLDQGQPFGSRALLPRGTLREPPKHLERADLIIITKCKQPTSEELLREIRGYNDHAEIVECRHVPVCLENLFTGEVKPLSFLEDKYTAAISGIAVPESFESLLRGLGAKIEFHRTFSDHHNFTQKEIDRFMERCFRRDMDLIVTTEKDAVRFLKPKELDVPVYFLRIEIEILKGQEHWNDMLDHICGKYHLHSIEHGYKQLHYEANRV